jgi:hypothetical protein
MSQPRQIRGDQSAVTLAHMRDAIRAGVAPVLREVETVKHELRDLREDVNGLAQRRGRFRRWLAANAGTAVAHGLAGGLIAGITAALTYFGTHL